MSSADESYTQSDPVSLDSLQDPPTATSPNMLQNPSTASSPSLPLDSSSLYQLVERARRILHADRDENTYNDFCVSWSAKWTSKVREMKAAEPHAAAAFRQVVVNLPLLLCPRLERRPLVCPAYAHCTMNNLPAPCRGNTYDRLGQIRRHLQPYSHRKYGSTFRFCSNCKTEMVWELHDETTCQYRIQSQHDTGLRWVALYLSIFPDAVQVPSPYWNANTTCPEFIVDHVRKEFLPPPASPGEPSTGLSETATTQAVPCIPDELEMIGAVRTMFTFVDDMAERRQKGAVFEPPDRPADMICLLYTEKSMEAWFEAERKAFAI